MRPSIRRLARISTLLLALSAVPNPAVAQLCDIAPRVQLRESQVSGAVGIPTGVEVTAYDPNGDAITSLTADLTGLLPGNNAVFTPNATNTAGALTWTPQAGQTGAFTVSITATNSLAGTALARFFIIDTGENPFVRCPFTATARVFETLTFTVYAEDPQGEPITSLTMVSNAPQATFTASPGNSQGTFSWTPGFDQGSFTATFTATSSTSASYSTTIVVPASPPPQPFVTAPFSIAGAVGAPLSFCVTAFDLDDPIRSLTYGPNLPTAQFVVSPTNEVGQFSWTPAPGDAGSYTVTFTATSGDFQFGTASTTITVAGDHAPTVTAPAAVNGVENQPIAFTVNASDPDGDAIDALTAAQLPPGASFVPALTNTAGAFSWAPAFGQAGPWFVVFTASNALSASATTQINVSPQILPTFVFATGGNKTLRLGSNKARWCLNIEPANGAYSLSDISLPSVVLRSAGTGSVSEIHATAGKSAVVGDRNSNDVPDLEVCFLRDDLRALFSNVSGRQSLDVTVAGTLMSGGAFAGGFVADVVGNGGSLAASIFPNPPLPSGMLSFTTTRGGATRVRLFDLQGRLVRTISDSSWLGAGRHEAAIDGKSDSGARLPSGIYYFRIEAVEGTASGRVALIR